MGFWIMLFAGIIGLVLIILSFSKKRSKLSKYLLCFIGVVLILFAIVLATPQGADLITKF